MAVATASCHPRVTALGSALNGRVMLVCDPLLVQDGGPGVRDEGAFRVGWTRGAACCAPGWGSEHHRGPSPRGVRRSDSPRHETGTRLWPSLPAARFAGRRLLWCRGRAK
ncbi:hypothetical protein MRX96_015948 [Rhipicephalus microplus]